MERIGRSSLLLAALSCTTLLACGDDSETGSGGAGGTSGTGASGTGAGSTGGAEGCPSGSTECGGTCVNTDSDNAHCGACDNACDAGQVCDGSGTCAASCPAGTTDCDGACVNTDTDNAHCGDCVTECDAGEVCDGGGMCAVTCQAGLVECGGTCVDPNTDETYCGAGPDCGANPGTTCLAGEICNGAGVCELSCQNGLIDCAGKCIDPLSDETYCGAGPDCSVNAGTTCVAGEVCNGAGSCELSCQTGLIDCNGTCIDPLVDETYCGAGPDCSVNSGTLCIAGEVCDGTGNCAVNCQAGLVECGGTCIDPDTDEAWCGAGPDCTVNAGDVCDPGESCVIGVCEVSCPVGQIDCSGQCIDPLIDQTYCGAGPDCSVNAGTTCNVGTVCNGGVCCGDLEIGCNGMCCGADEFCSGGTTCMPMVENGSFETGDFTGWTTQDLAVFFWPLAVYSAGNQPWPFFVTTPTDGTFVAAHGFDGEGPGEIFIGQDVTVAGNGMLEFDYRAAWDMTFGPATLPREFEIRIEDAGGAGAVLDTLPILTADPAVTITQMDTGDLFGQVDLSAYDGMTVFVRFVWIIPEPFTGPGMFQVDNIRATRQ